MEIEFKHDNDTIVEQFMINLNKTMHDRNYTKDFDNFTKRFINIDMIAINDNVANGFDSAITAISEKNELIKNWTFMELDFDDKVLKT